MARRSGKKGRRKKRKIPNYRKLYCEYHGLDEIPKGYHIHHKNRKRWDNRKENLVMMKAEAHMSLHARHRRPARTTTVYTAESMARYHGLR